jgi:hypothetical protein
LESLFIKEEGEGEEEGQKKGGKNFDNKYDSNYNEDDGDIYLEDNYYDGFDEKNNSGDYNKYNDMMITE